MRVQAGTIPVFCAIAFALPAAAAERSVAVFDFAPIGTSIEGEPKGVDPRQTRSLTLLAPRLRSDIRGNADEMWTRGVSALWRDTLKKRLEAVEAAP